MSDNTTDNAGQQSSQSSNKRKQNAKSESPLPATTYEVKSKGYSETFETKDAAFNQAEILKKRGIKNSDTVNVKILAQAGNEKPKVIHNIKIDEDFFD
jgi:hypothetical protein